MRLFIASQFSEDYIKEIEGFVSFLDKNFCRSLKIVIPSNIHLTYVFLGDLVDEKDIPFLKDVLEKFRDMRSIEFYSRKVGFFPSSKTPRVIWLDIDENASKKLIEIYSNIKNKLQTNRIYTDDRFVPHITVARVKGMLFDNDVRKIMDLNVDYKGVIKNIALFNSTLTQGGPLYTKIFEVDLL